MLRKLWKIFANFREKATGTKFYENSRIQFENSIMKQNINPVTLFSITEEARTGKTLFKANWEAVPVKLADLVNRNFAHKTFPRALLRSRSFEGLRVATCERLQNKASLSNVNKESDDAFRCQQNSCFRKCSAN